jgi:murein DD-endopeptidase MepM/ murein hydrolase activator NlpD
MKRSIPVGIVIAALVVAAGILFSRSQAVVERPERSIPPQRDEIRAIEGTVRAGDTMEALFHKYGLRAEDLFGMRQAAADVHALKYLSEGRPYRITLDPDNNVLSLTYQVNDMDLLRVLRSDEGFEAAKVPIAYERRVGHLGGVIRTSLYAALPEDDRATQLAMELSDIFSWDVDFNTDLRKGDTFRVVVEELWLGGAFRRYGNILAAELVIDGETFRAYRFADGGSGDYYDDGGKSLRRAFLKAPLSYRRISSGFTRKRLHPILKIVRPHLGVDYAAPTGTPVSSTGDGTIAFAGHKGANGKLVIVRHGKGYITSYGHLSRFGKGIRVGTRVRQGDVIGYVGATGRATGPHLDYRMKRNGVFLNPLKVAPPRGGAVASARMDAFRAMRDRMQGVLGGIDTVHRALAAAGEGN